MIPLELMLWAKREGYAQFSLGMAPLAGISGGQDGPIWNQIVSAVRMGGERYYNFQGIREFKAWFYPGETTGFEFVYPREQARKAASGN